MLFSNPIKEGPELSFEGISEIYLLTQELLNLDGRNCQKYLHQTKADFLTLIMLHKLTQSL